MQTTPSTNTPYSLHVTQLNYAATKEQLAAYFEAAGCSVKSCRLVMKGGKSKGVAFVDLDDAASLRRGLKLHRSLFMGRRVNVRKTLSPEELQEVVKAKEKRMAANLWNVSKKEKGQERKKRKRKQEKKVATGDAPEGNTKAKEKSATSPKSKKRSKKKLTKSERAKKAAIIRNKR